MSAKEVTIGDFWSEHAKGEDQDDVRSLEILKSMLGEEIHGQSVLCGERHFRGVCAGLLEHAHQPATGLVSDIPQVLVLNGSGIHV